MFTLDTSSFPTTTDELAQAVTVSLRKWVDRPMVAATGVYPSLDSAEINLSGATFDAAEAPPDVRAVDQPTPGPTVDRFVLLAKPIQAHGVAAQLELTATKVRLSYAHNRAGQTIVLLTDAAAGRLQIDIAQRDLENAALFAAQAAARPHGIAVQRVELSLACATPRELAVSARVTAKKLVTAIIRLSGRAIIDDQLNATLRNLAVDGDGMVAKIVVSLIRPHLQKLEGQQQSLLALPGNIQLSGLALDASDGLKLTAHF
ncbi:MAG TPA: hypothetical protein VLI90_16200 [Tepidisphaeraceae bacterium]|nr:hypothetical protein [Tepidisphaeraceae bacterium]